MDIAAVVISIIAVMLAAILACFGIGLQWMISRDTRGQATQAESLLSEIRGLTTITRETQERQFDTVLQAVVRRTSEVTTTGSDGIIERINGIEAALAEGRDPSERVSGELRQLRAMVETLKHEIPRAMQETGPSAEPPRIQRLDLHAQRWAVGERVEIRLSWHSPGGWLQYAMVVGCRVVAPDTSMSITYEELDLLPGHHERHFTYPDDFRDARTDLAGRYLVEVQLVGGHRGSVVLDSQKTAFVLQEQL